MGKIELSEISVRARYFLRMNTIFQHIDFRVKSKIFPAIRRWIAEMRIIHSSFSRSSRAFSGRDLWFSCIAMRRYVFKWFLFLLISPINIAASLRSPHPVRRNSFLHSKLKSRMVRQLACEGSSRTDYHSSFIVLIAKRKAKLIQDLLCSELSMENWK